MTISGPGVTKVRAKPILDLCINQDIWNSDFRPKIEGFREALASGCPDARGPSWAGPFIAFLSPIPLRIGRDSRPFMLDEIGQPTMQEANS